MKKNFEELLNADECAAYLKITKSALYRLTMKKGPDAIPRLHVGGRELRFRTSEVNSWLERKRNDQN